jgi:fructose-specific PTS system IIA-like component
VSLCGELGDDEDAQLILLGLGVDSLSIGAPGILKAKANLARSNLAHCRELADAALKAIDCAGVDSVLREFRREKDVPLLSADMIVVDSEAQNKTEAIKELTDLLAIGGRSEDTAAVEEAVWVREEACPTDFCHGFAVPHCKTDHVTANSITFLRLREPVDWESSGESAVRVVILLAIRSSQEGNEHLRILSHLSRLLMRAEFRDRLETAPDVSAVLSVFREELSL